MFPLYTVESNDDESCSLVCADAAQRISCLTGRGTGKQCQIPIAIGRFDRHLLDLGWLQNLCIRDRIMPCVVIHVNKKHFCPHRKMRQRAEVTRIVMSRDYQVICI